MQQIKESVEGEHQIDENSDDLYCLLKIAMLYNETLVLNSQRLDSCVAVVQLMSKYRTFQTPVQQKIQTNENSMIVALLAACRGDVGLIKVLTEETLALPYDPISDLAETGNALLDVANHLAFVLQNNYANDMRAWSTSFGVMVVAIQKLRRALVCFLRSVPLVKSAVSKKNRAAIDAWKDKNKKFFLSYVPIYRKTDQFLGREAQQVFNFFMTSDREAFYRKKRLLHQLFALPRCDQLSDLVDHNGLMSDGWTHHCSICTHLDPIHLTNSRDIAFVSRKDVESKKMECLLRLDATKHDQIVYQILKKNDSSASVGRFPYQKLADHVSQQILSRYKSKNNKSKTPAYLRGANEFVPKSLVATKKTTNVGASENKKATSVDTAKQRGNKKQAKRKINPVWV